MDILHTVVEMVAGARDSLGCFLAPLWPFVAKREAAEIAGDLAQAQHDLEDARINLAGALAENTRLHREAINAEDEVERLRMKLSDCRTLGAAKDSEIERLKKDRERATRLFKAIFDAAKTNGIEIRLVEFGGIFEMEEGPVVIPSLPRCEIGKSC